MKAMVIRRYGDPDVFRIEERESPKPGPDQVLVKVHGSSVNPLDPGIRAGMLKTFVRLGFPPKHVPWPEEPHRHVAPAGQRPERFDMALNQGDQHPCRITLRPEEGVFGEPASVEPGLEQAACLGRDIGVAERVVDAGHV